ncbi:MAG: YdcH family protein [Rhodospirillales bacterium]|nr:YdcH family protein [Rhodospirillales bacterium]
MSLDERIESLRSKHRALEAAIEVENNRPHPDDIEINRLKKQKLSIKDEIAGLEAKVGQPAVS